LKTDLLISKEAISVSGKPALVRKREVISVIKAAKQEGAHAVEVRWGSAYAIVHLCEPDQKPVEPEEQIRL
jgi:hypothetical protein